MYVIITTSVYNEDPIRKVQYEYGINYLKQEIKKRAKIIIIENNENKYVEKFRSDNCEIFYTSNNKLNLEKGNKELKDIHECIKAYNIDDNEFVIKLTGRYMIQPNSMFMKEVYKGYDCVIMYGSYDKPNRNNESDCITGLIGMKAKYIKEIEYSKDNSPIEYSWAKTSQTISNKCIVDELGVFMCNCAYGCPASNRYKYR